MNLLRTDAVDAATTTPPMNTDAERALLGAILIDNSVLYRVRGILPPQAFFVVKHQWVYESMLALAAEQKAVDFVTLSDEMERRRQLVEAGGSAWLMGLINEVPTSAHGEYYAQIVLKEHRNREAIRLAHRVVQAAYAGEEALVVAKQLLAEATQANFRSMDGPQGLDKVIMSLLDSASDTAERRKSGQIVDVELPFWQLNDIVRPGLMGGDLVLVVGEPAVGKSTFVHMIGDYAASCRHGVLVFPTEMTAHQFAARQIAPRAGVQSRNIRAGLMDDKQWAAVYSVGGQVGWPNLYVDAATNDLQLIELRIQQAIARMEEHGYVLRVVIVDYLQELRDSRSKDRRAEVSSAIRLLRDLAKIYDTAIVVVSSLERGTYRSGSAPNIFGAKESGDIEYAVSIGVALYRHPDDPNVVVASVQKNRDGANAQINLPPFVNGFAWYDAKNSVQRVSS